MDIRISIGETGEKLKKVNLLPRLFRDATTAKWQALEESRSGPLLLLEFPAMRAVEFGLPQSFSAGRYHLRQSIGR